MALCLVILFVLCTGTAYGQDPSMLLAIQNALSRAEAVVGAANTASETAGSVAADALASPGFRSQFARGRSGLTPPVRGVGERTSDAPRALLQQQRFNIEFSRVRDMRQPTDLRLETVKQLTQAAPAVRSFSRAAKAGAAGALATEAVVATVSFDTLSKDPRWLEAWKIELGCPQKPPIRCNASSPYRTADGSCNNLYNPEWGKSFTPQARYLPPQYDDDVGAARTKSVISGQTLPSARLVSRLVLRNARSTIFNDRNTMMLMAWGQFLDHDIVSTPAQKEPGGDPIICCGTPPRRECFNIFIPLPDPHFTTDCMNFVRSSPTLANPCKPGKRQQINQLTSYHDASNVYGSTLEATNRLRSFTGGRLKVLPGNLPPEDPDPDACIKGPGDYCPLGGDHRISEVVFLGANHVTWLRMHNLIADELRSFGNRWDEEKLFQETRKIIGALQQLITYDEYLPVILNQQYRSAFCLTSYCQHYSPYINAAIKNSFSTAALRMGHSQIPPAIGYVSPDYSQISRFPLRNHFSRPNLYIRDQGARVDDMQRFVTSTGSAKTDRLLELELADHLFTDGTLSFDLGALNIQRGRDHGLPPYVWFREFCGLPKVTFFASGPGGLTSHTPQAIALLKQAYRHQDDIDLYPGALSETPVPGGQLGPTFSCLFALQMRDLKVGDRFFWERKDRVTGFTQAQYEAIKRTGLSTILCQALKMEVVQPNVFFYPGKGNELRPCWAIPRLNLDPWREGGNGENGGNGGNGEGAGEHVEAGEGTRRFRTGGHRI